MNDGADGAKERSGQQNGASIDNTNNDDDVEARAKWSSGIQFLMSCIAFSVGLGNVWRFPYTAYENGGGAFLIPYIVVLYVIGKPCYYMEMILGQFSSRSCIKIWSVSPAFKGIGFGVIVASFSVVTYYCALMALILFYLVASFASPLPWTICREEWGDVCFSSSGATSNLTTNGTQTSSAELFFLKVVLNEADDISNGIGAPSWKLMLCLAGSWIAVILVLCGGVKSVGKASYFLALFPYTIMIALLIRAVTLPGAADGIIFLFKPTWEKIFDPQVWYAAVSQAFFSLGVCLGAVTMFSSYNDFRHNVNRDCTIVTTLDLCTSLLAGSTIFGILGNLAYESGTDDMSAIVRGGTGLAFISYPEALSKFTVVPQLFAVLFFLMLFVLAVGSVAAISNAVISVITDQFPNLAHWKVALGVGIVGFLVGITYCTPGGQYILNLVDYFAGTFILVMMGTFEVVGVSWVYGINNFVDDVEFMSGERPSLYWRLCWGLLTPIMLFVILIYFLLTLTPLTYNDLEYPTSAYAAGWCLLCFGVAQFPIWFIINKLQNRRIRWFETFKPREDWGPKDPVLYKQWQEFKDMKRREREEKFDTNWAKFIAAVIGR